MLRENRNERRCLELVLAFFLLLFFFVFSLQPLVGVWLGVGTEPSGWLLWGCSSWGCRAPCIAHRGSRGSVAVGLSPASMGKEL